MQSLTLLSWNIENLGRSQELPTLIAKLAVKHQADLMILLDPKPASKAKKKLKGAFQKAILPGSSIVRDICNALNKLEQLPTKDDTHPFQWHHLRCDPSFQPEDLPKVLTTMITIDQRGEVSLETGIHPSGQPAEKNSRSVSLKTASWEAEVARLRSVLSRQQWHPFIPAGSTSPAKLIKIPGRNRSAQQTEADFGIFYEKKCRYGQVKNRQGAMLYQQTSFTYTLKNKDFSNPDQKTVRALESVRKVLTDLGIIKANADTYHVLFRGMKPTGEGPAQKSQVVSISLPEDSPDLARRSYQPLPVMVGNRIHLRWLGLDGGIPGSSPADAPANGRAPGLLNTWWKGRYLPVFLSHMPLSSLTQHRMRADFDDLLALSIVPPDGSPISLTNAKEALLWLDTGLPFAAMTGPGPGKMLEAFAKKGKFNTLLKATTSTANDQKTALIDPETYLDDPIAFDHSHQFRSDAFDLLLFKATESIVPVPSRVLDTVELLFWGCLHQLQERINAGKLSTSALPNLTSFINEHAEDVRHKGALLPIDLFCLLGKTPAADMSPQALLGDAFLVYRTLAGAHLPVLTQFRIN